MNRSLKAMALLGIASTGMALPAFALPPTDWQPGRNPVLNVYYGGATATDNTLEGLFIVPGSGVCQAGTIDIYRVPTTNRGNRVIFCRARSGITGVAVNTPIAFHKESIGGSSNGTVPLARQQTLQFFNMANAGTCTNNGTQSPAGLNPYTQWTCPDSTVNVIPDGGISDTEANLSFPQLSKTEIATLRQSRGLGVVFGVPVSLNLYRALQVAQGLPQDDVASSVPSLTRAQIRGLYSGQLTDWNQITSGTGTALPSVAGVTSPTSVARGGQPDTNVFICRRVASSGTQASYESYWLQQRCDTSRGATSPVPFAVPDDGSTLTTGAPPRLNWESGGGFVNASEGSGDVRNCFAAHQTNGTWAIGTLSTEVSAANLTQGNFRMVRVDGALPNLASMANGDYDFFTENVLVRRQVAPLPNAAALPLLQFLESDVGSPAILSLVNVSFRGRPWGDGGVVGIPTAANGPNLPPQTDGAAGAGQMRARPVNSMSRSVVNNTVNNCNPPVMIGASPTP
jgi:hypothetical protein